MNIYRFLTLFFNRYCYTKYISHQKYPCLDQRTYKMCFLMISYMVGSLSYHMDRMIMARFLPNFYMNIQNMANNHVHHSQATRNQLYTDISAQNTGNHHLYMQFSFRYAMYSHPYDVKRYYLTSYVTLLMVNEAFSRICVLKPFF